MSRKQPYCFVPQRPC